MEVWACILGKWLLIDDKNYIINGDKPTNVIKYGVEGNGYMEIARKDTNDKCYIHYRQFKLIDKSKKVSINAPTERW